MLVHLHHPPRRTMHLSYLEYLLNAGIPMEFRKYSSRSAIDGPHYSVMATTQRCEKPQPVRELRRSVPNAANSVREHTWGSFPSSLVS